MEFTDIAMELSKKAWQASFHHPFILQLQEGNLEPAIFRYLPDSGCLLSEGFLRNLSSFG
ncbi:transcriptional activator TenA, TENA/THI-4 family protein [Streptococcus pneumoniae]|nr:transcriptional activator TenA, TENA/THI-4 family protein [Streptococcus pneumoniae]